MCEESKGRGGGFTLCPVLQQWELASNNSLHSINCMELDCAINHKLIMINVTTNPKHSMTCSRNAANRDHSAIHVWTTLSAIPSLKKARACGVPVSPNALCLAALNQMNRRQAYRRRVPRSRYDKTCRAILRRQRYYLYDTMKNQSYYSKGQLDPKWHFFMFWMFQRKLHTCFIFHDCLWVKIVHKNCKFTCFFFFL